VRDTGGSPEGPEKVPGLVNIDRLILHWLDGTDGMPAQNVDIRTRPKQTDGLRWA